MSWDAGKPSAGSTLTPKLYMMQGNASIEEWELFADPRELERRKAERRRAALPPEVRISYMSINQ